MFIVMVSSDGFEPPLRGSKPPVLPLDEKELYGVVSGARTHI